MSRLAQELSGIFKTAGEAHGFAFVQVDGEDDDWAYWYAGILQQPLSQALGRHLTRAQIVVCLMTVEDERLTRFGSAHPWPEMYADHFITAFAPTDGQSGTALSLYYYPECPYCQRVLRAIDETGADVELRHIWDEPAHRAELQAARGRTTVPVLRISGDGEDRWMPESADIAQFLRELAHR